MSSVLILIPCSPLLPRMGFGVTLRRGVLWMLKSSRLSPPAAILLPTWLLFLGSVDPGRKETPSLGDNDASRERHQSPLWPAELRESHQEPKRWSLSAKRSLQTLDFRRYIFQGLCLPSTGFLSSDRPLPCHATFAHPACSS